MDTAEVLALIDGERAPAGCGAGSIAPRAAGGAKPGWWPGAAKDVVAHISWSEREIGRRVAGAGDGRLGAVGSVAG